jgi:hypothetical protein
MQQRMVAGVLIMAAWGGVAGATLAFVFVLTH